MTTTDISALMMRLEIFKDNYVQARRSPETMLFYETIETLRALVDVVEAADFLTGLADTLEVVSQNGGMNKLRAALDRVEALKL